MSALALVTQPPHLGAAIDAAGLTRVAVARRVGVSVRTVARWCADVDRPSPPHAAALAALLPAYSPPGGPVARIIPLHPEEDPDMEIASLEPLPADVLKKFGLTADPFEPPTEPEDVWRSSALTRLEAILETGLRRRQIIALCGPVGAGKSTLIRRLCAIVGKQRAFRFIAPGSLDRARINAAVLATAVIRDLTGRNAASLSAEARGELLRTTLAEQRGLGVLPVLVIDEAHLLSVAGLISIKQIWDSHLGVQDLAVILVGQPALRDRLKKDMALKEVTGRTAIIEMSKLSATDAADYLAWRCARAGATRPASEIFTAGAVRTLAARAEHPLWLNNLAARALATAASVGDQVVTEAHIAKV